MSLKVPRGFQTFSEDAIVQKNAQLRRMYAHQDRMAQRANNDQQNLSFLAKAAIFGGVVIAVAVLAKPVTHFVMSCL